MKDGMILYASYAEKFQRLTDAQFGRLIRLVFKYQAGEDVGNIDDFAVSLAFDVIRYDLDRNNEKYERIIERNRENGKKGGRPKNPVGFEKTQDNPEEPKKADKDKEKDKVEDKDINNKSKRKRFADDDDLNNAILDFIEHRRKLRKPMTDHAVQLFLDRLNKMATDKDDQINLINVAILKGWQTVYPSEERLTERSNDKLDKLEQFYLSGKKKKDGKFGL